MDKLTKLVDDGILTNDPGIASIALGENITSGRILSEIRAADGKCAYFILKSRSGAETTVYAITIPFSLIWKKIQPVKGGPVVVDSIVTNLDSELVVWWEFNDVCAALGRDKSKKRTYYHKWVLNIVTTRAELRELVLRCEDDKKYWRAICPVCGWKGLSKVCEGGGKIADTGDYDACLCPVCFEKGEGKAIAVEDADEWESMIFAAASAGKKGAEGGMALRNAVLSTLESI